MAHPAGDLLRDPVEKSAFPDAERGASVFTGAFRRRHLSARQMRDELRSVADPENRYPGLEHVGAAEGRAFSVYAGGASGEDDPAVSPAFNFFRTYFSVRLYLGEDVWRPGKDPEFDRRSVEVSRELKDVYRDIASRRGNGFLAASDYVTPSSIDDEHMDDEGHLLFAQAVYGKLREIWL